MNNKDTSEPILSSEQNGFMNNKREERIGLKGKIHLILQNDVANGIWYQDKGWEGSLIKGFNDAENSLIELFTQELQAILSGIVPEEKESSDSEFSELIHGWNTCRNEILHRITQSVNQEEK